jgi:hypothetical protein
MYCIISLPRTASTFAWSLINNSLLLSDTRYSNFSIEHCEPFNLKYGHTVEQNIEIYKSILQETPLPVIKILSNYSYDVIPLFKSSTYKLIFLKPNDVRKQILRSLIMNVSQNLFGNRTERIKLKGSVRFTEEQIKEKLIEYKNHMKLEMYSDYSFYDTYIINQSQQFLKSLGLPPTRITYRHIPPIVNDEDLLIDVNEFNQLYNQFTSELL